MKTFRSILTYLWQLPQNLLGLLMLIIGKMCGARIYRYPFEDGDAWLIEWQDFPGGVSLGEHIFLKSLTDASVRHEHGHCIQSRLLGPLYLLIIGVPSLLGNIWDRVAHKDWNPIDSVRWYYNQPWEKWADKLGGVKRNYI